MEAFVAELQLTAAGSVDEFDVAAREALATRIATLARVDEHRVTLRITTASVRIVAMIRAAGSSDAATLVSGLSRKLSTADSASEHLGLRVVTPPVVQATKALLSVDVDGGAGVVAEDLTRQPMLLAAMLSLTAIGVLAMCAIVLCVRRAYRPVRQGQGARQCKQPGARAILGRHIRAKDVVKCGSTAVTPVKAVPSRAKDAPGATVQEAATGLQRLAFIEVRDVHTPCDTPSTERITESSSSGSNGSAQHKLIAQEPRTPRVQRSRERVASTAARRDEGGARQCPLSDAARHQQARRQRSRAHSQHHGDRAREFRGERLAERLAERCLERDAERRRLEHDVISYSGHERHRHVHRRREHLERQEAGERRLQHQRVREPSRYAEHHSKDHPRWHSAGAQPQGR